MTKLFITGATGYIGGDALYAIVNAHPEYEITCLVRNTDKGAKVAAQFPSIRLVYGDLDTTDLIETESKAADIVCHFAHADHEASAHAIIKGLSARRSSSEAAEASANPNSPSKPAFLIHTSGTGILTFPDIRDQTYGQKSPHSEKIHNDLDLVHQLTTLPDDAPHRNVDKIILAAAKLSPESIKTAIVCPPTIYGLGRGPDNQTSIQIPGLCRVSLQRGGAVRINEGETYWNHVHVRDLSALYLELVQEAASGGSTKEWAGKPATWGEEGYFFCEAGEHVWREVSEWIAEEGVRQKFWDGREVTGIKAEEAQELRSGGPVLWGTNSRGRAKRGRVLFGWEAKGEGLKSTIAETLRGEARRLGMVKGYGEVAAGDA